MTSRFGVPVAALGLDGCRAVRVPQAPQKANPTWTIFPQVGQGISPAEAGAAAGVAAPVTRTGAGVTPAGMPIAPPLLTEPDVTRGPVPPWRRVYAAHPCGLGWRKCSFWRPLGCMRADTCG